MGHVKSVLEIIILVCDSYRFFICDIFIIIFGGNVMVMNVVANLVVPCEECVWLFLVN